jgi:hypothetical protein
MGVRTAGNIQTLGRSETASAHRGRCPFVYIVRRRCEFYATNIQRFCALGMHYGYPGAGSSHDHEQNAPIQAVRSASADFTPHHAHFINSCHVPGIILNDSRICFRTETII